MNISLTIVANMTSNYGEGLGNISSIQKVFRSGKTYAIRSRESLKNAIMTQSGMYDDLKTVVAKKVNQKVADKDLNVANCRALEGGYMNTDGDTVKRNSSFYLTDAVSCNPYIIETRFHNNLAMAENFAKDNNINLQKESSKCGLMPYQYEYEKDLKIYSITIDLDKIGKDENFDTECDNDEKYLRVEAILDSVEHLSLLVKGNLDNAEPLFVIGGIVKPKTHYFENVVKVRDNKLIISDDLKKKKPNNCAVLKSEVFENQAQIIDELGAISVSEFFENLKAEVKKNWE